MAKQIAVEWNTRERFIINPGVSQRRSRSSDSRERNEPLPLFFLRLEVRSAVPEGSRKIAQSTSIFALPSEQRNEAQGRSTSILEYHYATVEISGSRERDEPLPFYLLLEVRSSSLLWEKSKDCTIQRLCRIDVQECKTRNGPVPYRLSLPHGRDSVSHDRTKPFLSSELWGGQEEVGRIRLERRTDWSARVAIPIPMRPREQRENAWRSWECNCVLIEVVAVK